MTDELIAHLAKDPFLARDFAYVVHGIQRNATKRSHRLHEILNVDALVEGTVLRSGDRVRITAELVQVATDRHLWAETYESQLGISSLFKSHVASAIVNEIRVKLSPEDQVRLATARPVSTQSYENTSKAVITGTSAPKKASSRHRLFSARDQTRSQLRARLRGSGGLLQHHGSAIVGTSHGRRGSESPRRRAQVN